ncbi:MAG: hypothetical protein ACOCX5_04600 [Chloroflexota bacterium]
MTEQIQDPYLITRANRRNPEGLPTNRQGRMTVNQRTWLFLHGLVIGLTITGPGFVMFVIVWNMSVPLLLDGIFFLLLMLAVWGAKGYFLAVLDAINGEVYNIQGKIEGVEKGDGQTISYWYRIGNIDLHTTRRGYRILDQEQTYVVYYAPHSKRLMNIEPYTTSVQGEYFTVLI